MKIFIFTILVLLISGCTKSKLSEIIDKSTVMEIHYTDMWRKEVGMYKTNFSGEINMLNNFFNGKKIVVPDKCYPEGFILLISKTDTTYVDLGLDNECQRIVFTLDGIEYTEDITLEGVTFFKKNRFKVAEYGTY